MAQRQLQETVNLPPSGFIGSSPIAPTIFGSIVKRISRNATDVVLKVRILLDPPFCPGDGIGIRIGLRSRVLRVRLPPWAPFTEDWQRGLMQDFAKVPIRNGPEVQILHLPPFYAPVTLSG